MHFVFPNIAHFYWLLPGPMISNDKTVSCQKILSGLHCKSLTSEGNSALLTSIPRLSLWDWGCALLTGNADQWPRLLKSLICYYSKSLMGWTIIFLREGEWGGNCAGGAIGKNWVSAFYHLGHVFDLKKILVQVIAHQENHAQPKREKKIHAPENCPTPTLPSLPSSKK